MAALSWRFTTPLPYTITSGTEPNDWLAAINSHFSTNSGAADAVWEVVSYVSSSPRSVLLRRKNGSPGRIVIFGQAGSTPNAAAVRSGAPSANLYIGYSATSTSNTVDQSWLSGAPLTASDYIPAVTAGAVIGATRSWRLSYAEHSAGVILLLTHKSFTTPQSTPTVAAGFFGAGEHFVGIDGSFLSCVLSNVNTNSWTATVGFVDGTIPSSYGSGSPGLNVQKDSVNYLCARLFSATLAINAFYMLDDSEARYYFAPVYCLWDVSRAQAGLAGKLRQMGIGPQSLMETFLRDADTDAVVAYGLSAGVTAVADTFWLFSEEV